MTNRTIAAAVVAVLSACDVEPRPVDAPSMAADPTPTSTSTATSTATPTATSTPTPTATPTPTSTPTPTATSTSTPTPTATSTARPPPAPVPTIRSALAREPSGATALSATAETVVDPAATFEVELAHRLADARMVLVDAADAHVASTDVRELAATTRLTLAPEAPLAPGSRYVLRIDGAAVREMHDADGRAFAPIGFGVLAAGTPPPEPKKPPRKRRR
ncbi:MAG TPA: hypothetical protein VFL83_16510 [Anaeromyxobacter sp.]|nr:hypothetical protein [Anaeromyxobacter sp.]